MSGHRKGSKGKKLNVVEDPVADKVKKSEKARNGRSISPNTRKKQSRERLEQFFTTISQLQGSDLDKNLAKMVSAVDDEEEREHFKGDMEAFRQLYHRWKTGKKEGIEWDKIKPPQSDLVARHSDLPKCSPENSKKLAKKLAVVKLNGGLGTSMGCTGPKSIIEVHSGLTFLDLTVHQIQYLNESIGSDIPLILMDSFNTHSDTLKIIKKYEGVVKVDTFLQSRFPRILKDNQLPMPESFEDDHEKWYPPGHGDFYRAFYNSGLLEKLLSEGVEYVFVSNVDNLGATIDFEILNWMDSNNIDFVMEVTDKTRSDVKGGTLIDYEGKAKLFEIAQCPPNKVDEFKSIKKFKIFNTNNLWVSLKGIKKFVQEDGPNKLDVIANPKKALGKDVIQLETASGAAIQFFENAKGVNVERKRFLPVKSTSDLFVVQSNLYELQNGALVMNPKRPIPSVPLVNLGALFKKVSDYEGRLANIPDILELDQLTVSGDVTFGSNVVLRGTVIIVANHPNRIDIPSGAVLENKVVAGNLRILDH